uniref:CUB domain-containing protein n=1 Tax=Heliothis virescens TaxID=7102 RepID=A0A2A4JR71_HELVI
MSYCMRLLLVLIMCVKQEAELAIALRKFVYQKDMSEYCRRRVMPSVFLGRQVIEAYSQILHFSRLELPYSCFVSIRTESGSNIILVIQLMSDQSLIDSCRESKNQLLVYELGETFGGYWGALPDKVMKMEPPGDENGYTLKTSQSTTTKTTTSTTQRRTSHSSTQYAGASNTVTQQDAVFWEFPIVNVSASLVPGRLPVDNRLDPEESFDVMFDVKPRPDVSYKTKILPLFQFSLADGMSARRTTDDAGVQRFDIDFNADLYTQDPSPSPLHLPLPINSQGPSDMFSTSNDFKETKHTTNSWDVVNAILKNLSRTKDDAPNTKVDENLANLLQGLAKIGHNESFFLVPNASWYTRRVVSTPRPATIKYQTDSITWRQPSATYRTNYFEDMEDTSPIEGMTHEDNKSSNINMTTSINDYVTLLPPVLDVDQIILNVTQKKNTDRNTTNLPEITSGVSGTTTASPGTMKPLTLLDHESWENMVHAAPQMAEVLNHTASSSVNDTKQETNASVPKPNTRKTERRKKRLIHAIPIENAKPRHLPIKPEVAPSTEPVDRVSDAQEFQRLIEVEDDEAQDRVALRYLGQYVGPALFNICDFDEAATRHVYLFNSSRLVLAITNFTLTRMTVVMTPARTLLTSEARCGAANLECQVSGARVCIDSLSACDGVPNCGSYDIYDEDRLTCGGTAGLQHNVCLAAITFLAVLLTVLYTVHYWLKRCVPKVSDAFFIYTDAAENILYLDPIMRSPHDTDYPKLFYQPGAMHDYLEHPEMQIRQNSIGTYLMDRFLKFFRLKRKKKLSGGLHDGIAEANYDGLQVNDSFDELELGHLESAFTVDVAVQTGSSFEIENIERILVSQTLDEIHSEFNLEDHHDEKGVQSDGAPILDENTSANPPLDELSILKFFRKSRSISMQMSRKAITDIAEKQQPETEDKEIQSVEFPHDDLVTGSVLSIIDEVADKKPEQGIVQKKLRFEGESKTGELGEDDAREEEIVPERRRRSVMFGGSKRLDADDSNSDINEPSTSNANKEGIKSYFWSKNKHKKATKKKSQQLPLR